jgi:hypothetical protein
MRSPPSCSRSVRLAGRAEHDARLPPCCEGGDLGMPDDQLPYAIANALFGGTAEYVALWFKARGTESGFYIYVTVLIGVSLVVYLRMPETRDTSRIQED